MDLSIRETPGAAASDFSWLAGDDSAFETAQSATLDIAEFVSGTHYDATTKVIPSGVALSKSGSKFVPFGGINEVQSVTITGSPTGGTFTLTFDGETTAAIAYNALPAAVQSALEGLSNVNPGDIVVSGTAPAYVLTFGGQYRYTNVPQLTSTSSLTGGSSPAIAHATSTAGVAGVLDGFVARNEPLLKEDGTLSDTVIVARILDAVIIPANLPVAAHRTINQNTPTTGKFAFVN